jgi:hypothetical protein
MTLEFVTNVKDRIQLKLEKVWRQPLDTISDAHNSGPQNSQHQCDALPDSQILMSHGGHFQYRRGSISIRLHAQLPDMEGA